MSVRLLQKNTKFLLTWLPAVLLLCSVVFYFVLKMHSHHMQEKQLLLKQSNVWNAFISTEGKLDRQINGEYIIKEGTPTAAMILNEPIDTLLFFQTNKHGVPTQQLTSTYQWKNQSYLVTTFISSKEVSHLTIKVFITEAIILALLLVAIVVLNNRSSKSLWQPFFSTVQKLNRFDISKNQDLHLPTQTGTTEFDELNKTVGAMIQNVVLVYQHQKQFVENASHEMQTPLAIIRSKLELLINQPDLTEKNAALLGDIAEANNRMSQMNRTLLLLAKIENNQFPETELVNLSDLLNKTIADFTTFYEPFPSTSLNIESGIVLQANPALMEILIANIIKNAVVHNIPEGQIRIGLSKQKLVVENSGPALTVNPQDLFDRFKKGSHETKTTGLGLALVKQICSIYGFRADYSLQDSLHSISIHFEKNPV